MTRTNKGSHMNTNRSGISGNERPQQPTTSVTMLWNIVNGLKLVRGKKYEENDPRVILYQKEAAEFFEKYKLWAKNRIKATCWRHCNFSPTEAEVESIYHELYYFSINEEHLKKDDPSSPMIIRIQKALENKLETGKPFASNFKWWIRRACKDWKEQYHCDNESIDGTVANEEGNKKSYLDANEGSIQKSSELPGPDRWIHVSPSPVSDLEAEDSREIGIQIKEFAPQVLVEAARIPDYSQSNDSQASNDCKIADLLAREFIFNPGAPQQELARKYGISQPRVSYLKKSWAKRIKRNVWIQLKRYQPGQPKSGCIGNSLESYRLLVNCVYNQIGEKVPCEILLQNFQLETR